MRASDRQIAVAGCARTSCAARGPADMGRRQAQLNRRGDREWPWDVRNAGIGLELARASMGYPLGLNPVVQ